MIALLQFPFLLPFILGGIIAYFAGRHTIKILNQKEAPSFKIRLPLFIFITISLIPLWMPLVQDTPLAIPATGYTFGFTTVFAVMSCIFIYSRLSENRRRNN
ncbi:MAG: hypothetical protein OXN19_16035 [Caldilineaceae bacterium]|nr:hypothetical protein [Caldilineaceae bacterium]